MYPSRRKRDTNTIFNNYTRGKQLCSFGRVSSQDLIVVQANSLFAGLKFPGNRISSRTELKTNSLHLNSLPTSTRNLFKATEYAVPVLRQPTMMFKNFIHQRLLQSPVSCGTLLTQFKSRTAPRFVMVGSSMTENLSWVRSRMGLPRRDSGTLTSSPNR